MEFGNTENIISRVRVLREVIYVLKCTFEIHAFNFQREILYNSAFLQYINVHNSYES